MAISNTFLGRSYKINNTFTILKFNDTTTETGLCQDVDFWVGTDTSSYPMKDKARNINTWYRKVSNLVWSSVGDWEYDDTNLTTLPVATTDLVDGQADYELPSTAQRLDKVEVMDSDGDYQLLSPITKEQVTGRAMTELYEDSGMPEAYDMMGRSIILYPTPASGNVTLTNGLKIYVARDIDEFNSTSTSKEPGFANNFHRILSMGAAMDYAISKGMTEKTQLLIGQIREMETDLKEFYSRRHERDFNPKIIPHTENFV